MERLKCTIEQVIFQNPENGYSVFQVDVEGDLGWQTIVGSFQGVDIGSTIVVDGEWKNDKRFGKQFSVISWFEELPATVKGIEKYLSSGLIKGIGKKNASLIVKRFGADTLNVIDKTPERLLEVQGIGKDRMNKIMSSWKKQKDIREVMVFLQGHGISATYAAKIYKEYRKDSIKKVKENPYCLADDIFGIGFKMADAFAQSLGYGKNDPRRCRAGLNYTLTQLANDGHCYAERNQLLNAAVDLLMADMSCIIDALDAMVADKSLVNDDGAIFLPLYYKCECNVAGKIKLLLKENKVLAEDVDIKKLEEKSKIQYDEIQADAIRQALKSKVMVLTGSPGTGKTTTTLGIITALESYKLDIICAAPTGRAAKRMSESTGKDARTIHRLLEYKPEEGFSRNADNPLSGDVLIVDESSMIDIALMNSLMKAVPEKMRVILVGDIDQLPSVGAGNVLRDIIDSGVVPVVRLTRIFRQALTSRIITNAHKINKGEYPDMSNGADSDFFFIKNENPESVASEIVNIVKNRIPKAYNYNIEDIQVLVPMIKGVVGVQNLNVTLQEAINPVGESIKCGMYNYRQGDKVMQIKNNYDKNVFNGDVGTVVCVDTDERTISVRYDSRVIEYESSEFHELSLAYACTIHKSQGSEYPVVVMPLMMSHYVMLQRNLVYTGVTRAKKICIVIGDSRAMHYAIKNFSVLKRNTRLKERLKA